MEAHNCYSSVVACSLTRAGRIGGHGGAILATGAALGANLGELAAWSTATASC
jgi:hypothetical protein